jgi:hypothetical protein
MTAPTQRDQIVRVVVAGIAVDMVQYQLLASATVAAAVAVASQDPPASDLRQIASSPVAGQVGVGP